MGVVAVVVGVGGGGGAVSAVYMQGSAETQKDSF
jgi:hypothetical protein